MSEENGGIATTAKIRRTRRGDGRGREKGSERGRETWANVKTLITGTKRSTGTAEATTQTRSPLKTALYSSALDRAPPHPPPVALPFFLLQKLPHPHPLFTPPSTPLLQGCCCYLYDLNIMHKRNGAHSATRLGPLWTLKSLFFYFLPCSLYSFTSTTERVSLLRHC